MKFKNILICFFIPILFCGCIKYSTGERTGTITKFSEKGFIFKTWEGKMTLGGVGATGASENIWDFSCEDKNIIEKIKQKQRLGELTTLKYNEELIVAPWRGKTKYIIIDVLD